MVFSGRPSTACLACRRRRLNCDRIPAGCSQCKRKNIVCTGYRDPSALRVKDETEKTWCKFEKKASGCGCASMAKTSFSSAAAPKNMAKLPAAEIDFDAQTSITPPCGRVDEPLKSFDLNITVPLRNSSHHLSIAYFFSSYIYATSFQEYVPAFFLDSPRTGDACSAAIEATAIAAYSRHVRSCTGVEESRKSPESAVLDRTLACVLVLGLFEAIVFEGGARPDNWTAHTQGAMQLLRLRGPQQFKSRLSRTISSHASNNIKTCCIQRSVPVPEDFLAFDRQLRSLHDILDPSTIMAPLMHTVASIKAKALANPDCNLIHDALRLDRQIILLSKTVPDWMVYEIRPECESPSWAYKRACHHYPNARAAKAWNGIRLFQFFLVIFIMDFLSPEDGNARRRLSKLQIPDSSKTLFQYVEELKEYVTKTMDIISTDLLATIPVFLENDEHGRRFIPVARSLVWPLAIVECSDLSPKPAREFARQHLDMLAGDLNIPGAVHPARFDDSVEDWLHLFHLG
ncbi:hypothetical protein E4U60_005900 [Claviceps pazoutovae]|uniref:Zn(2)-C6 fungal-type domain-containing protein n=1 Tax=Claviceps pazoutovae TaxID=1649127 RepID=A0A9P7MH32_9HYPO|nr:hypothetical protein E4U60_005900 [Claviceps pazoutovae]